MQKNILYYPCNDLLSNNTNFTSKYFVLILLILIVLSRWKFYIFCFAAILCFNDEFSRKMGPFIISLRKWQKVIKNKFFFYNSLISPSIIYPWPIIQANLRRPWLGSFPGWCLIRNLKFLVLSLIITIPNFFF